MRRLLVVLGGAVALAASSVSAAEVSSGYSIVVPDPEPSGVQRALVSAAETLKETIREGSGIDLPIVTASAASGGKAICLGAAFAERAGISLDGFAAFDNLIAEKDGNVYLCGRDKGRAGQKNLPWKLCTLPSVRAVTRFMHDWLDVRFLAPGAVGRDIPKIDRIDIPDGLRSKEHPLLDYGTERHYEMAYDIASNVLGLGAYHSYGGHTYPDACPPKVYFKDHPEYFALQGGRRVADARNPSLCISNPAIEDLLVRELCRRYDAGADVCQLCQQDAFTPCECAACATVFGTKPGDWGEKLWILHRNVAARIARERPGKLVQIMAYGPAENPPKSFREFPPNVMIESCRTSEESFRAWEPYRIPHGFTVYTYLWGEYPRPGLTAKNSVRALADFARLLIRNRVHGIYRCGYGELFGTEGPGYYVFNNLLTDPDLDVRSLVTEYCARAYGPAAEAMLRFHDVLDARLDRKPGRSGPPGLENGTPYDHFAYVYAPDAAAEMEKALTRAEKTSGLTEKQTKRIGLVRTEFDYAKNLGRIAVLYAAYRLHPSWGSFEPLGEAIMTRQAMLDALYTGPGGSIRKVEGWPEIRLFGGMSRFTMDMNGTLGARLGSPLGWDVPYLREKRFLPCSSGRSLKVGRDLEAAAWQDLGGHQLEKLDKSARFRVARSETSLVFEVESDLADGQEVRDFGRDGEVWKDESADILIDPSGTGERVHHFIFSPVEGSIYDAAFGLISDVLNPKFGAYDPAWDGKGWTVSGRRGNGRWQVRVEVPYAALGVSAPKPGDRWRLNVAREWTTNRRGNDNMDIALWNPNLEARSVITPAAMGELVFE